MKLFNEDFLSVQSETIVKSIKERGYFSFENAVTEEFLSALITELGSYKPSINTNELSPVWFHDQYFFSQALAASQNYYNYIVSEKILSVCRSRFDDYFRLKCHRYYETSYGHSMEWHADNVTNTGAVTKTDGLIFILYIDDVVDGEFQLIENTYKERKSGEWSYNYTNNFIEEKYKGKIKSFTMPAGSLIIYDTFGIHRAKPITNKRFTRKSIFFQVDSNADNAEQILINPAYINNLDNEIIRYLGFGKKQDFKANPTSSIKSVPLRALWDFQKMLCSAFLSRLRRYIILVLLSHDQIMRIRRRKRE